MAGGWADGLAITAVASQVGLRLATPRTRAPRQRLHHHLRASSDQKPHHHAIRPRPHRGAFLEMIRTDFFCGYVHYHQANLVSHFRLAA